MNTQEYKEQVTLLREYEEEMDSVTQKLVAEKMTVNDIKGFLETSYFQLERTKDLLTDCRIEDRNK